MSGIGRSSFLVLLEVEGRTYDDSHSNKSVISPCYVIPIANIKYFTPPIQKFWVKNTWKMEIDNKYYI